MKHPRLLLLCIISAFLPNIAKAAAVNYTVKLALAIPFDVRKTGTQYHIPVAKDYTPITLTIDVKPGENLDLKMLELSKKKLRDFFSDIPDFADQVVHLVTKKVDQKNYVSIWFAPGVPQTKKTTHLKLGTIPGMSGDDSKTLDSLYGINLLDETTRAIDALMKKALFFRYVFLFAPNAKGETVVTYKRTAITTVLELREQYSDQDYETFGIKKAEQEIIKPNIDLYWTPEFVVYYNTKTQAAGEIAYPYYYCTAVPAEEISARKPGIHFTTIAEVVIPDKSGTAYNLLTHYKCLPELKELGAIMPIYEQNVQVVRPIESIKDRATYKISRLFNKLYLMPLAESLRVLATKKN